MTKEELKKATGQELIEQRDYCGVDGYYRDYLDDVNEEMLKRFNRLAELEKENTELKERYNKVDIIGYDALKNLTKAKELLKRCYENYIYLEPTRSEIEQFLKEIEK